MFYDDLRPNRRHFQLKMMSFRNVKHFFFQMKIALNQSKIDVKHPMRALKDRLTSLFHMVCYFSVILRVLARKPEISFL